MKALLNMYDSCSENVEVGVGDYVIDEDKCVVIKCDKCSLGEICLQICDELEEQDRL
ncbi:TPA: hypothetical protein KOR49_002203 [Clostridioides difficile]|uniref:hypothetical protein n=1 Tax=Clostridioides difficile TaxID=1496 RepID=UPI00016C6548|nr:hypothetical protein [Clostridioides difficile]MBG0199056.1 hypothetical protein [Clostridioides difficile]MCA0574400.1 hypothetical protein [Clostridioides difficile]SJT14632.1 Uncharacterised protein [Clostridioides difficile]VHT46250.1 Uncharacterised protein [Clostridioides difficile]HBE8980967.1 hypothetical protein [Clostridioides difficile]